MTRKTRKKTKAEHNDPINFTCGSCMQVHEFDLNRPYLCDLIEEEN